MSAGAHRNDSVVYGPAGDTALMQLAHELAEFSGREHERLMRKSIAEKLDDECGWHALCSGQAREDRIRLQRTMTDQARIPLERSESDGVRFVP